MSRKRVEADPWERQKNEGIETYADFCVYRDLGPGRSIPKAAELQGKNVTALWQASAMASFSRWRGWITGWMTRTPARRI